MYQICKLVITLSFPVHYDAECLVVSEAWTGAWVWLLVYDDHVTRSSLAQEGGFSAYFSTKDGADEVPASLLQAPEIIKQYN